MEKKYLVKNLDGAEVVLDNTISPLNYAMLIENEPAMERGITMYYLSDPEFSKLKEEIFTGVEEIDGYRIFQDTIENLAIDIMKLN